MSEIDKYIDSFPTSTKEKLVQLNQIIRGLLPMATEKMSYQMPTYYYHENVVHFAGYKKHIGFYPTPSAVEIFEKELGNFKYAKGSIQFPLDQPLPTDLIIRIVRCRLDEVKLKHNIK